MHETQFLGTKARQTSQIHPRYGDMNIEKYSRKKYIADMKMWSRQTKKTINNNLCFNINNKSYSNVLGALIILIKC